MKSPLKSRRFWAALAGIAFVFFGARAGLTETQLTDAILLIITYIGGVSLDAFRKG